MLPDFIERALCVTPPFQVTPREKEIADDAILALLGGNPNDHQILADETFRYWLSRLVVDAYRLGVEDAKP